MHDPDPSILASAVGLVLQMDSDLWEIVMLSLQVSLTAVLFAALIGIPLGAVLAVFRFRGRGILVGLLNALMGLPPVVVGLMLYLLLSRSGIFGSLGLLFTATAMIIAQFILVTPIVAALSRQTIHDLLLQHEEQFKALGVRTRQMISPLLWDGRVSLLTAVLAGFGRASAEVGAVLIVGGNINHATRVMTTTIAMETSKGNLELAMALGFTLITISVIVTALIMLLRHAQSPSAV
jgi:tungstate transport system permease protein